ncbi:MAG: fibronectin type III domain-containing protein [Thermoguttaceae bacterium]
MPDVIDNKKKKRLGCGSCCFVLLIATLLLIYVAILWVGEIAERTIFLDTDNLQLVKTYRLTELRDNECLRDDPRIAGFPEYRCMEYLFLEENDTNNTAILYGRNGNYENICVRDFQKYIALISKKKLRGNFDPRKKFIDQDDLEFYQLIKTNTDEGKEEYRTKYLGAIKTNMYRIRRVSATPDGKYILMSVSSVDSRSLGEFRSDDLLLVWKIGDQLSDREIITRTGQKATIVVKTEADVKAEFDKKYLDEAKNWSGLYTLENPPNFLATVIDDTSVRLSWDRSRGADSYRISVKSFEKAGCPSWEILGSTDITNREFVVQNLSPETKYIFKLETINSIKKVEAHGENTTVATTLPAK